MAPTNSQGHPGDKTRQNVEIQIIEVIQAGDVFLVRFSCPECSCEIFSGTKDISCINCGANFFGLAFRLPNKKNRCLTGTFRKTRGGLSKARIRSMLKDQDGRCAYCSQDCSENYQVEHILPLSFGGSNAPSNLCLSCPSCNHTGSDLVFDSFASKQEFVLSRRFNRKTNRRVYRHMRIS